MTARADYIAGIQNNTVYFSDIPTNLDMSPNSGDLAIVTNIDAIAQSIENLTLTIMQERLNNPTLGSSVPFRAFELGSIIETEIIKTDIMQLVANYEPRVIIRDVRVVVTTENNSYDIAVIFSPRNEPATLVTATIAVKGTR